MATHPLSIRLLGGFHIRLNDAPLRPLESARAESLLAFLVLHRDAPQARRHLAFLLWPDSTEAQARTNLRHVLFNLRRAVPDIERYLEIGPRTFQWRAEAPLWLDVAAFDEAIASAQSNVTTDPLPRLHEAVELYRGDLLEGLYDEWLLAPRERLRLDFFQALEDLAALLAERGDYNQAISYAEQLLRHDPLREWPYRLLMQLHDARGDRARALRVYHEYTAVLERELGVEPSDATREAYEALLPQRSEADALRQGRLGGPPLVGRASEWQRLTSLWRTAELGHAQLVLVTGEPGIGKTRLLEELRAWCSQRGALASQARSHRAEGALAYGPVVTWLRSTALQPALAALDTTRRTTLARLLPELGTPLAGPAAVEPLSESEQRHRLFDAVATVLRSVGAPLLLVADDLHWSDPATLQLIHYVLRVAPEAPLLVAVTARREELDERHPLNDLVAGLRTTDRLTEIEVGRLNREETDLLAERLTTRAFGEQDADRLWSETEGNPLFIIEALRAGWTAGAQAHGQLSPRVQTVIEQRLAQLSEPARRLVGVAAVIGSEFTAEVVAAAGDVDDETLVGALDELWRRRIIRERGAEAYDFTHDRIREVAYLGLGSARRRFYHRRVAQTLERLYADDMTLISGQLAAQLEQAGAIAQAVHWYARAAETAQQLHANVDAVRLLERAINLLRTLPETPKRQAQELALLTALPAPLVAVEGYLSARVTTMHERSLVLTRALSVEPDPPLLRSLALANLSHYDFEAAQGFGEQLRAHGERDGDDVLIVQSGYVLGITAFWKGDLEAARRYFEEAVERCRPEHRPAHFLHYGHDPESTCLTRLACTLCFLGFPEAAERAREGAFAIVEEIGHPYSRALTLVFASVLALEMHDLTKLRAFATELLAWRTEDAAAHVRATFNVFAGYLEVLDGRVEEGVAHIQRTLDDLGAWEQAPGQEAMLLRVLLEACAVGRDAHAGLWAAERLLTDSGGVQLWRAETHRFRAEFLKAQGASSTTIEEELHTALAIARSQGARLFELRAATALLRHHLESGDSQATAKSHAALAALIKCLPQRQDTADLRAASDLLCRS